MINIILQRFHTFLSHVAVDLTESAEVGDKKIILVGVHLLIIPNILVMALLYYAFQETLASALAAGHVTWCLVVVFIFPRLHKDIQWWGDAAGVGVLTFLLGYTLAVGGLENSGYILPLCGLANPLVALLNFKPRHALLWLLLHIASIIGVLFLQPYLPLHNLPPIVLSISMAVNSTVIAVMTFSIFIYFINQRNIALHLLHAEQEKSERLLLNVLPYHIAQMLKNEPRVIADHFSDASVLFADIVNFTPMSAKMTPTELVELLNEVFSSFDALVEKHGLEKIKTIGDCYMVAAGVPQPNPDHAHILTRLALDLRDYVNQHQFQGKSLTFRIGINSGAVMAGVIGRKKFIYDLWGDTVNTASRMESYGKAGYIQITAATYMLIKDDFICEPGGIIDVKGKGEMTVWYVLRSKV